MPQDPPRFNAYFIETHDDGTFRFLSKDGGGKPHVCLNVDDRFGEWCEIVAWEIGNPARWWLRYGDQTPILGAEFLAWCNDEGRAVTLHGTPEGWIMGRGKGVCVLDWRVDLRPLFEDVPRIECESQELRDHLRKALLRHQPKVIAKRGQRRRSPNRGP